VLDHAGARISLARVAGVGVKEERDSIPALTGIRGVLALWVVLAHLYVPVVVQFHEANRFRKPALAGSLVVDTFFLLSGFIITYAYSDRLSRFTWTGTVDFWRHRFARIYPVHFVAVVVFVIFGLFALSLSQPPIAAHILHLGNIVRNLLFLHTIHGGIAIDSPAWSLPDEVVAYLTFPLLVLAIVRIKRPTTAFVLAAIVSIGGAWIIAVTYADDVDFFNYKLSWLRVAATFPVGCLLSRGWMLLGDRRKSRVWDGVALVGLAGMITVILTGHPHPNFYIPPAAFPFLGLIVIGCAGATGIVRQALSHRLVVWAGRISFSVYMTHYLIVLIYVEMLVHTNILTSSPGIKIYWFLATLIAIVILGAGSYRYVEEPARRALGRRRPVEAAVDPAEPEPTTLARDIPPLTGIRAIAAMWVVMFHFFGILVLFFPAARHALRWAASGSLGVDLFFVLSGFVLTHNYLDTIRPRLVGRFLALRLGRIYPVHLLTIVAYAVLLWATSNRADPVLAPSETTFGNFVRNLLLLNAFPGGSSINSPAWSVSLELAAYIAFPAIVFLLLRIRRPETAFALAAAVLLIGTGVIAVTFSDHFSYIAYHLEWMRIATAFPAGCLLNVGWRLLRDDRRRSVWWDWVAVLGVVGVLASIMATPKIVGIFYLPIPAIPMLGLVVLACAGSTGFVSRFLSSAPMQWGGRISYSLYMTHYFTLIVFGLVVFPHFESSSDVVQGIVLIGSLAATIAIAGAVHHLVEEPARRAVRRVVDLRRPAAVESVAHG
jgi:peptidoglycan/LPS O-acetylase OafA/YrhL